MSKLFENLVIERFSSFDKNNFRVLNRPSRVFLCGGVVDATAKTPPSLRDRIYSHTAEHDVELHDSFVLAEAFKDYFKENRYPDLLVFEEDIANASSLVLIFLESAGSLVELGLFCNRPDLYNKLFIVAPQHEVEDEDSFIYLGPLEYIRKKSKSSVHVFPWPQNGEKNYDIENLEFITHAIHEKLDKLHKQDKFEETNTGHLTYLISSIITLIFPVIVSDIEYVLMALGIDNISPSQISRYIYLLDKLEIIKSYTYSNTTYYYPCTPVINKLSFGAAKQGGRVDTADIRMNVLQLLKEQTDESSKKKRYVLKKINELNHEAVR